MRKILLLGGTGAMGKHLAQILDEQGDEVYITSRLTHLNAGRKQYIHGNARNIEFLRQVLKIQEWDAIVDFMVYSTEEFSSRVQLLLDATRQYLFLSSSRVYADSNGALIKEESPRLLDTITDSEFLQTDEYALTKARQEDILHNSSQSNWTIIRPYITYSENRLQLGTLEKELWLKRALRGNSIVFCEEMLQKKTTLTYGYDVASAIAALMCNPLALGEAFHITQDVALSWQEVLSIYLDTFVQSEMTPPRVLMVDLKTFHQIYCYGKYQVNYDRMYDRVFDTSKIKQIIDTQNFINPEVGLRRCLKAIIQSRDFQHEDYLISVRMDKVAHETRPLREFSSIKTKAKYLIRRYILK